MIRLLIAGCFISSGLLAEVTAEETAAFPLWEPATLVPAASETPLLQGVRFSVIKKREPEVDGYNWLHGLALAWHNDMLFSFWGHNKSDENTPTEVAQGRHSLDGGVTWSPVWMLAPNVGSEARSHGVFLSHKGILWAFLARFGAAYADLKTEAFRLIKAPLSQEDSDITWESTGVVADGFWPCDRPVPMENGNWIMAGARIPDGPGHAYPVVAISRGNDFTRWDTVAIPVPDDHLDIWGETTLITAPEELTAIVRAGGTLDHALVSTSLDFGCTWYPLQRSNLPMPGTKAYAGQLSTGQRYVVGTLVRDHGRVRHPLTLAVSRPGENYLSRLFCIRDAVAHGIPGESVIGAALSYPYAVEHKGFLYVAYSNDGGRGKNLNSAEMAVIPLASLK